ncbi:hypothetical protein SAMN06264867_107123 [Halorubrum cibi]|uniref:Uncharacterized protein n=1 Tax=Halorubrum cibi TaxID=413815 RepID=A0A521DMH7_9EURY|nr:hypothetical protein SAMN06264867_107123 [Halorubrum cibi]
MKKITISDEIRSLPQVLSHKHVFYLAWGNADGKIRTTMWAIQCQGLSATVTEQPTTGKMGLRLLLKT